MFMKHNTYMRLNLQNVTFSGNFDSTLVITCYSVQVIKTFRKRYYHESLIPNYVDIIAE